MNTPVLVFEEFLASLELNKLRKFAEAQVHNFVPSLVLGANHESLADSTYRRSQVLYDLGPFHNLMERRLMHFFPHIVARLQIAPFKVTSIELQMTITKNGEFFRAHTDCDSRALAMRTVTFVYYCHSEPHRFWGGELLVYEQNSLTRIDRIPTPQVFRPRQNSILFFRSDKLHEIAPVFCPSQAFADSRLTLNGWFRR